jgi:hypothetical protein
MLLDTACNSVVVRGKVTVLLLASLVTGFGDGETVSLRPVMVFSSIPGDSSRLLNCKLARRLGDGTRGASPNSDEPFNDRSCLGSLTCTL